MADKDIKKTECLFCSMCCEVAVEATDAGIRPSYEGLTDCRRCARGHYIAELLRLPKRLNRARVREDGVVREISLDEAVSICVEKLNAIDLRDEVAVIVDGNKRCEDLSAAVQFAERCLDRRNCAVFLPPADEELLNGLFHIGFETPDMEAIEASDAILMVGDGFATHPVIARSVLEARDRARANRFIVIDSIGGKAAKFATDAVRVTPCGEVFFLEALVKASEGASEKVGGILTDDDISELADKAGVSEGDVRNIAEALKEAETPVILISSVDGRTAAYDRIGALSAALAAGVNARLLPLLSYGNGLGAYRFARVSGLPRAGRVFSRILNGEVKCLISIGADLASALPAEIWQQVRSNLDVLMVLSPLPNESVEAADIVFPSGFWFEANGTVLDSLRGVEHFVAIMPPPKGACSDAEILHRVAARLTGKEEPWEKFNEACLTGALEASISAPASSVVKPQGETVVVGDSGAVHCADGSVTRFASWAKMADGEPVVRMSPTRASAGDLKHDDTAIIETEKGKVQARVEIDSDIPDGVVALSIHFGAARAVFEWEFDSGTGRLCAVPVSASVGKKVGQ